MMKQRRAAAPTEQPIITALLLLAKDDVVVGVWEDEGDEDALFFRDVVYDAKTGVSDDEAVVPYPVGLGADVVGEGVELWGVGVAEVVASEETLLESSSVGTGRVVFTDERISVFWAENIDSVIKYSILVLRSTASNDICMAMRSMKNRKVNDHGDDP